MVLCSGCPVSSDTHSALGSSARALRNRQIHQGWWDFLIYKLGKWGGPIWACPNWVRHCFNWQSLSPTPQVLFEKSCNSAGLLFLDCSLLSELSQNLPLCCGLHAWRASQGFLTLGNLRIISITIYINTKYSFCFLKKKNQLWWSKSPRCPQCFAFHLLQYLCD